MPEHNDDPATVAETVRAACVEAARLAYEDAGIRGLCAEGRWEAALAAIQRLDLTDLVDARRVADLPSQQAGRDGAGG